jgi:putative acetyltransferase
MNIRPAVSDEDWAEIKGLFREYFDGFRGEQGIDLNFQDAEAELKALPGKYSPPAGCMLLAEVDGHVAGCVALRPLDARTCELKRMYVRPEYRAKGVGRALGEQIIREAKSRGYELMRLDTADTMTVAQKLYHSLGFTSGPQYYDVPPRHSATGGFHGASSLEADHGNQRPPMLRNSGSDRLSGSVLETGTRIIVHHFHLVDNVTERNNDGHSHP